METTDFLSSACELLHSYGIPSEQLAVVVISVAAMAGVRVSGRLLSMASCGAASLAGSALRYTFSTKKPEGIEADVLAALSADVAKWDGESGVLTGTGGVEAVIDDRGELCVAAGDATELTGYLSKSARKAVKATIREKRGEFEQAKRDAEVERLRKQLAASKVKGDAKANVKDDTKEDLGEQIAMLRARMAASAAANKSRGVPILKDGTPINLPKKTN